MTFAGGCGGGCCFFLEKKDIRRDLEPKRDGMADWWCVVDVVRKKGSKQGCYRCDNETGCRSD